MLHPGANPLAYYSLEYLLLCWFLVWALLPCYFTTSFSCAAAGGDTIIILEDFSDPKHAWEQMNDPEMGGKSTGTFTIDENHGHFVGNVAIVPFLKAPGFIKVETKKLPGEENEGVWPDISSCRGMQLKVRSKTLYTGYRLSFGKNRPPDAFPYIYGYKTNLPIGKIGNDTSFVTVQVAFDEFSDNWDARTGDPLVPCRTVKEYCPDMDTLKKNLYSIAIWGEGVEGEVDLEIQTIAAYGCTENEEKKSSSAEDMKNAPTNLGTTEPTSAAAHLAQDEILIEDFSNPTNHWSTLNDPVMGGQSYGEVTMNESGGFMQFNGKVNVVPSLQAPGFITAVTGGFRQGNAIFPDVSSCKALKLVLRTDTEYRGYRVSFGNIHVPNGRHARGYKAPALDRIPVGGDDFGELILPFNTFSSKWDEKTGDIQVACSEDAQLCPDESTLHNMETMSFWGEGVEGAVTLDIKTISAVGCSEEQQPTVTNVVVSRPQQDTATDGGTGGPNPTVVLVLVVGIVGVTFIVAVGSLVWKRRQSDPALIYDEIEFHPTDVELA